MNFPIQKLELMSKKKMKDLGAERRSLKASLKLLMKLISEDSIFKAETQRRNKGCEKDGKGMNQMLTQPPLLLFLSNKPSEGII